MLRAFAGAIKFRVRCNSTAMLQLAREGAIN